VAIYTLSTSSSYSAIKASLANGDTIRIDTNAVRLTINEQPLLTGIIVDSPGVSGRMTVSGAYDLSTWSVIAGTVALIDGTFPAGATLGSATAGSATGANGIATNAGTVIAANGSPTNNATGIGISNGTVTTATGGGTNGASGVNLNLGSVTNAIGGSANGAPGVASNFASVVVATGGSTAGAHGVAENNSTVTTANGGSAVSANGVATNSGIVLRAFDFVGRAINLVRGGPKLIIGPDYQAGAATYQSISKIYSIGEVSNLAAIPLATEIVILSEGSSGGFSLSRVLN